MSANNGGPAFPRVLQSHRITGDNTLYECAGGMTLRDYFAAKAMQTLCANEQSPFQGVATLAYELADAMLRARGEQ